MQVQYYHPVGPHLFYHYAAIPSNPVASPSPSQHLTAPPPPPHPYFAFPLMLQQQLVQQQQQQQQHQRQQHQTPGSPAAAAAAAFFAQQQQLAGLALHFQSLSVSGNASSNAVHGRTGSGSSSSGSNKSCSSIGQFDIEQVRSASFDQPDYQWKLLVWLKTHRMHKYFDRLRKYSFDQLVSLDRDTLAAEQFTQGAIKKLLGMLERVRADRGAFESPTRSVGATSSSGGARRLGHQNQQPQAQLHRQQPPVFPPTLSVPPPPPNHHQQQNLINYHRDRYLCNQK